MVTAIGLVPVRHLLWQDFYHGVPKSVITKGSKWQAIFPPLIVYWNSPAPFQHVQQKNAVRVELIGSPYL